MAGNKYLQNHPSAPGTQEVAANQTSAGAGDAGKIVALNSSGVVDITMMPSGVGTPTQSMTAGETLAAGDFVYINTSDANKIYKADADAIGKKAIGYVLAGASAGAAVTVYFEGKNDQLSGLTIGLDYYLSATAGGVTTTKPSTAGQIVQYLGTAITTSSIPFNPTLPLEIA